MNLREARYAHGDSEKTQAAREWRKACSCYTVTPMRKWLAPRLAGVLAASIQLGGSGQLLPA